MLAVGMLAQVAGTVAANAVVFLIPYFHRERGLTLTEAGLLAATPLVGTMLTLVAWGAIVDRVGERTSLVAGLTLTTIGAVGASQTSTIGALGVWWFVIGIGAASTNSASGRLVVGWFPAHRRGTAMGIRQTALPIGMGVAALLTPNLVRTSGLGTTLLVIAGLCTAATAATAVLVVDPPRPTRREAEGLGQLANPYRGSLHLTRIHVASALLVVPQITVWTFMLVWLIDDRGWATLTATVLVAASQVLGSAGRIGAGWWSDRVGSRLGPMRTIAVAAAVIMLALGVLEETWLAVALIVVATTITVADNGLAFTAVAEIGGPYWAGRAMGMQNTGQYLAAALVPPLVGATITGQGYAFAFAAVAVFPLLAIPIVPTRGKRHNPGPVVPY